MNIFYKRCALILLCMSITGCSWLKKNAYDDYSVGKLDTENDSEMMALVRSLKGVNLLTNVCYPGAPATAGASVNAIKVINPASAGASVSATDIASQCAAERDLVLSETLSRSDTACTEHLKTIYGNDAAYNIILGSLTSLFTGAAAVTNGISAKSWLSTFGFFTNSERSLINDVVYKTVLVPAIHSKIIENRTFKRSSFRSLYGKPISEYPISLALSDALDYHYSCSFMEGMRLALKEGTNETKALVLGDQQRRAESDMAQARLMFAATHGITTGALVDGQFAQQLEQYPPYQQSKERYYQGAQAYKQIQASVVGYVPAAVTGSGVVSAAPVATPPPATRATDV